MEKPIILGTGLTGLIGTRIVECLKNSYAFESISRANGIDIVNKQQVMDAVAKSSASTVLHLAAKADVDGCEKDKDLGKNGEAWILNVGATENIVEACKTTNKKLIYVSTDFVFDGDTTPDGGYTEEHDPDPVNWYAATKYHGEQIVQESGIPYVIIRPAYPYGTTFEKKVDFVRGIIARFKSGESVNAVIDHIFCPTFIDDIAHAVDVLIHKNAVGIYHTAGAEAVSPYDVATIIAKEFGFDETRIQKSTRVDFFANRAPRPFNLTINSGKINTLGVKMRGFEEGVADLKNQISPDVPSGQANIKSTT